MQLKWLGFSTLLAWAILMAGSIVANASFAHGFGSSGLERKILADRLAYIPCEQPSLTSSN